MKRKLYKKILGTAAIALFLIITACSDILTEQPRNIYDPGFFKTEKGVEGGLTGLYGTLRRVYGQPYYYNACETGTDEYTYGSQADQNFKNADISTGAIPDASNSRFDVIWNVAYAAINSASAIITNGTEANMSPALIAEAYFFRGFYYFQLIQTFGGVPLDLGSGELQYNTTPSRVSTRNTVPEVYTRAIFKDLLYAVENLPEKARLTGTVTKNTARLILAKAYLTYGWWLENPNNIPTFPVCDRTDPDGHDKAWYFQQAYDVSATAINNPGVYALQPTYYDVHVFTNDRNKEIMLYADHTEDNPQYNEGNVTGWDGSPNNTNEAQNQAVWMVTWYFQSVLSSKIDGPWTIPGTQKPLTGTFFRSVRAGQSFSRMWSRMATPINIFNTTFADKTNDSRFDGTFVSIYRGTWNLAGSSAPSVLYNANYMPITPGEPAVSFLTSDPGNIQYAIKIPNPDEPNDRTKDVEISGMGLGVYPGRADWVMPLNKISRTVFPGLWKLGVARKGTDYNDDKVASTRPFNILKFSEFYFIAAEAAVKGASTTVLNTCDGTARGLINVIRARAGKWSFSNADNIAKTDDNSAAMVAATPAAIDVNYILDERSREYFGEGYRWHDLARTQKWEEYAGSYQICTTAGDATPVTVNRNIEKYLYLRPIPTSQLDNMEGDKAYKKAYQNPGYN